jgi:hypothetical protein
VDDQDSGISKAGIDHASSQLSVPSGSRAGYESSSVHAELDADPVLLSMCREIMQGGMLIKETHYRITENSQKMEMNDRVIFWP